MSKLSHKVTELGCCSDELLGIQFVPRHQGKFSDLLHVVFIDVVDEIIFLIELFHGNKLWELGDWQIE
jgi:hypothetical protein